jgi:curved DNA-binding protein CbpA
MSGGVPEIKKLWTLGEELSVGGQHSEALLNFQRAMNLLQAENKALYGTGTISQDGSGNKLVTEIATRLTVSINRDVKLINANAVHALGLKRGFSKSDVKKAYRVAALKYHPDKNKDCDTSCIFAAIQSGYEKLNATLDAGDNPAVSAFANPVPTASNGGRRNTYGSSSYTSSDSGKTRQQPEEDKHGPNYHYTSHKDIGRRDRAAASGKDGGKEKPSPYTFDQNRSSRKPQTGVGGARERDSSPRPSPRGGTNSSHESRQREKAASALSSDHLKILLKQFGFTDRQVNSMARGELLKKYVFCYTIVLPFFSCL